MHFARKTLAFFLCIVPCSPGAPVAAATVEALRALDPSNPGTAAILAPINARLSTQGLSFDSLYQSMRPIEAAALLSGAISGVEAQLRKEARVLSAARNGDAALAARLYALQGPLALYLSPSLADDMRRAYERVRSQLDTAQLAELTRLIESGAVALGRTAEDAAVESASIAKPTPLAQRLARYIPKRDLLGRRNAVPAAPAAATASSHQPIIAQLKSALRRALYGAVDQSLEIDEHTALIVVDASPTFMPGGGLAVPDGDAIVDKVRRLFTVFPKRARFATQDWHPRGHISLASSYVGRPPFSELTYDLVKDWSEDPKDQGQYLSPQARFTVKQLKETLRIARAQRLWPDHGVQGTPEAELHPSLPASDFAFVQKKGQVPERDSYSGLRDNINIPTGLAAELRKRGFTKVVVVGLAYDYCVSWTAVDAAQEGFGSLVVEDATRPVGMPANQIHKARLGFMRNGVRTVPLTEAVVEANEGLFTLLRKWLGTLLGRAAAPAAAPQPPIEDRLTYVTKPAVDRAFAAFQKSAEPAEWYELVAPQAPHGGGYIVSAGVEQALAHVRSRRFDERFLGALAAEGRTSADFLRFLAGFRYSGDVLAVPEGRVIGPGMPLLRFKATPVEKELLEELFKNWLGFMTAVATKASRVVDAANGEFAKDATQKGARPVAENGQRRAQGEAAPFAAEATIVGGAAKTSNVKAGELNDVDVTGTMAHLFIQLFGPGREAEAFATYAKAFPDQAVFLLDTWNTLKQGAPNAAKVARALAAEGHKLKGVRLDSGDLAELSKRVRAVMDSANLGYKVPISATNDLDERAITELLDKGGQVDFFGVGTNLTTGGTQASTPLELRRAHGDAAEGLLVAYWRGGERVRPFENAVEARARRDADIKALPAAVRRIDNPRALTEADAKALPALQPVPEKKYPHPEPLLDAYKTLGMDLYYLTMGYALFKAGLHKKRVTFDYFYRKPPPDEGFVTVAGVKPLIESIDKRFEFVAQHVDYLRSLGLFDDDYLQYLKGLRFHGAIDAVAEGSVAFANEPSLRVTGDILEAQFLEPLILRRMNYNSLVATRAAKKRAQSDDTLIEDALSQTQGPASVEAARSAYIGGVDFTTNIDARAEYKIPLADEATPGQRLGSDPATGGPKLSLGGVYKLSAVEEDGVLKPRIKISETEEKTSLPGVKADWVVLDAEGRPTRRVVALEGEVIPLKVGETARPLFARVYDDGAVGVLPDEAAARERARHERLLYSDPAAPKKAELSEGLSALRRALVHQAEAAITPEENRQLRVAMAQIDVTIGNFRDVADKTIRRIEQAEAQGSDLLVLQETLLTGYPAKDLWLDAEFLRAQDAALQRVVDSTRGKKVVVIVGAVERQDDGALLNVAHVVRDGGVVKTVAKHHLAAGEVYDDPREMRPGPTPEEALKADPHEPGRVGGNLIEVNGVRVGIAICEDIWQDKVDIVAQLKAQGATDVVVLNGSHFFGGKFQILGRDDKTFRPGEDFEALGERFRYSGSKWDVRDELLRRRSVDNGVNVYYVNGVGGQDEVVLEGGSRVYDSKGKSAAYGRQFHEDMIVVDRGKDGSITAVDDETMRGRLPLSAIDQAYEAVVLGLADYMRKTRQTRLVLGLSGGIDSSVIAAIACDAMDRLGLPRANVIGLSMPSRYSSRATNDDARELAQSLGITYEKITIRWLYALAVQQLMRLASRLLALNPSLGPVKPDNEGVTLENVQPRLRTMILLFLSNIFGDALVLASGNDTEARRGFSTLGGDLVGGYGPLYGVPKPLVFRFGSRRNELVARGLKTGLIPQAILKKAPSPELKPGQTDENTLGFSLPRLAAFDQEYQRSGGDLDDVIRARRRIDPDRTLSDEQFAELIYSSVRRYNNSEFKRRQAPPFPVITPKGHTYGQRRPIAVEVYVDKADILERIKSARLLGFMAAPAVAPVQTDGGDVRFAVGRFPDGELNVVNLDSKRTAGRRATITRELRSADDLVEILLIIENLRGHGASRVDLRLSGWSGPSDHPFLRTARTFADSVSLEQQGGAYLAEDVQPLERPAAAAAGPIDAVLYVQDRMAGLAAEAAKLAGKDALQVGVEKGERLDQWTARVPESMSGKRVALIHSTENGERIAELLAAAAALKKAGAASVTLINTYEGYARQDQRWLPGQTIGAAAVLAAVDRLADRHLAVNVHYGDKIEKGLFHGERIETINGFGALASSMFSELARQTAIGDRPILLVAPDDGAFPLARQAAEALSAFIAEKLGRPLEVRAAYLDKVRIDAKNVQIAPELWAAPGQPLTLPSGKPLKDAAAFVLDDVTAEGSTLLGATYALVRGLGLDWRAVYAGVVQGKLNRGLAPFETGLTAEELKSAAAPKAGRVDDKRRQMPPVRFFAADSLPLPASMNGSTVSLAPVIAEAIRSLDEGR